MQLSTVILFATSSILCASGSQLSAPHGAHTTLGHTASSTSAPIVREPLRVAKAGHGPPSIQPRVPRPSKSGAAEPQLFTSSPIVGTHAPALLAGAAALLALAVTTVRRQNEPLMRPIHILAASGESTVTAPSAAVMAEMVEFLREDLTHLFDDQGIDASRYDPQVKFQDPITRYDDLNGYLRNIQFLRLAFTPTFKLHSCEQTGPREITTRWTMGMKAWILPWQPELLFTGRTFMTVSPTTNKFDTHRDEWDSIQNNAYLSPEAVQDLLKQVFSVYATPDLKTPEYEVLRRFATFEVRRYQPYVVAETPMGNGAGAASGSGFNTLAGYIFGGNAAQAKMNMTTPVYTTIPSPGTASPPAMQFVMEESADKLPKPNTADVTVREVPGQLVAAVKFTGIATDGDVARAEKKLREDLQQAGVPAEPGYVCARYNEPTALPFVRRNEVLIRLQPGYDPLRD